MRKPFDQFSVRTLWQAGHKKAALWKLCPFSFHNPAYQLGDNVWPKGCLKNLKLS